MSLAIAPVLLLPLVGLGLCLVLRGRRRAVAAVLVALATTGATLRLAAAVRAAGDPGEFPMRGPFGIEVVLIADGLAATMLVMAAVVITAVAWFALAEDERSAERRHVAHWPLVFALWAGMNVLFLAGDLLTAYLMLELTGVCGAILVTLRGGVGSLLAGTRYLYAELAASAMMLSGVGLVWSQAGTVVFDGLGDALGDTPLGLVGLAAITVGLLLKAPLVPLHFWLPAAHTLAPSAVSPILSAVMVKVAFVVLIRLWFLAAPQLPTAGAAYLLGGLGAVAVVWGSVIALQVAGLKQLIAASTLAQIGLLFLLPPLVVAGALDGWTGGVVMAVAHALAKAALLMAAAIMVDSARQAGVPAELVARGDDASSDGETNWPVLEGLRGSAARRPVAMMAFAVAGVSLVGLPPTGGFVGKWFLLLGSVAAGQWWWVVVIVVGTLMTVAYLMRFVRPALAVPAEPIVRERDGRDLAALVLAGTTVALGTWPGPLLELLAVGAPGGGG